jgi:hypothetical protein
MDNEKIKECDEKIAERRNEIVSITMSNGSPDDIEKLEDSIQYYERKKKKLMEETTEE